MPNPPAEQYVSCFRSTRSCFPNGNGLEASLSLQGSEGSEATRDTIMFTYQCCWLGFAYSFGSQRDATITSYAGESYYYVQSVLMCIVRVYDKRRYYR